MSLPVKRKLSPEELRWSISEATPQQCEAALLNAQRTVQAFREILAIQRAENAEIISSLFLRTLQRDNARAALAQAQELNATLREQLEEIQNRNVKLEKTYTNDMNRLKELGRKGYYLATPEYSWADWTMELAKDIDRLREQLATVTAKLEKAEATCSQFDCENDGLKSDLKRVTAEREALNNKLTNAVELLSVSKPQEIVLKTGSLSAWNGMYATLVKPK